MISAATIRNFLRNIWDLILEGYWSTTSAISAHPHIVFWAAIGLLAVALA